MSLQRIPHDTTKYKMNPVELVNIGNRQRIGVITGSVTKVSPTMTANNAPNPYVVSSQSDYSASYPAWKAMDGVTDQDLGMWSSADNSISVPPWWKIDFGSNVMVDGYKLMGYYTNSTYPTAWTFYGSNDDSNWTQLDSRTTQTLPSGVLSDLYQFSNTTTHRYYKITITAIYGPVTRAVIGEIELYKSIVYNNYIGA
jgi:hypothetical protein